MSATTDAGGAAWWRRGLALRATPAALIAFALLLATPSLTTGLSADDHLHHLMLRQPSGLAGIPHRALDLFTFLDGDPAATRARIAEGHLPWWSDFDARLAFLRPLTALTHLVDARLFAARPALEHAHSLLWFGLVLVAAWVAYRRLLPAGGPATLALLLYALDDAHGPTLGWIANRNALVAAALALPALALHDRWRRDGDRWSALAAMLSLALGLLGGEAALSVCGYLAAYAIALDSGPWSRRLRGLVPCGLVVLAWGLCYRGLGYGARGSGVYLDPLHDRWAYAAAVVERLPVLLAGALFAPWSDLWPAWPLFGPLVVASVYALAVAAVLAVLALALPLLRRDRWALFFAIGTPLAALPVCAMAPADRLLMLVSFGGAGLVSRLLLAAAAAPAGRARRAGIAALVAVHVVLAPLLLPLRARSMDTVNRIIAGADRGLPSDEALREKTVVLLNPPGDLFAAYLPIVRESQRRPRPRRMTWLATGNSEVTIERLDERTLRVSPRGGFCQFIGEQLARSPRHPPRLGETIDLDFVRITITRVGESGQPLAATFRFATPLEDPAYVWLRWGARTYEPARPPALGQTLRLPAVDMIGAMIHPAR